MVSIIFDVSISAAAGQMYVAKLQAANLTANISRERRRFDHYLAPNLFLQLLTST